MLTYDTRLSYLPFLSTIFNKIKCIKQLKRNSQLEKKEIRYAFFKTGSVMVKSSRIGFSHERVVWLQVPLQADSGSAIAFATPCEYAELVQQVIITILSVIGVLNLLLVCFIRLTRMFRNKIIFHLIVLLALQTRDLRQARITNAANLDTPTAARVSNFN